MLKLRLENQEALHSLSKNTQKKMGKRKKTGLPQNAENEMPVRF